MEARLTEILQEKFQTGLEQATNEQVYYALLTLTKERIKEGPKNEGKRKLYYISAEFLIGKLLSNNLINLGIYDETAEVLKKHGKNLAEIEEVEPEPSLGNGGLGRLAACFLDSIATLGLPGDGIGLNYHMGLFKQVFTDHKQDEQKNPWIEKDSWLNDTGISFEVPFKDFSLRSHLYDIDVTGYEGGSNKLHLFDVETVNDAIVGNGINFDKNDIRENLTLFLYPDDSDKAGNLLRIYQQYFMVSNAAQYIIRECAEKGYDLRQKHLDCGMLIFDSETQDTHAGGSGCGCAAVTLASYLLPKIESGAAFFGASAESDVCHHCHGDYQHDTRPGVHLRFRLGHSRGGHCHDCGAGHIIDMAAQDIQQ